MNRYQCIKNYYVGPDRIFTAGKLYESYEVVIVGALDQPWFYIIDNHGDRHEMTRDLRDNFQELLDLNVDDYAVDQDERHVYPVAAPSVSLGCAIAIAAAISAGFFIYKIITWNS